MKRTLTSIALAAAALAGAAPASAAIVLSLTPSTTAPIAIGDSINVTATISGLGAEVLSAYDLNFLYDPSILTWNAVTQYLIEFGTSDNGFGEPNGDVLPAGNLGLWLNSWEDDAFLVQNQADSFVIASFSLKGIANGTSQFTLGSDLDFERMFVGLRAEQLDVQVGNLCIAVGTGQCATVPEPASFGLAGLALLAAAVARRSRRKGEVTSAA